MTCIVIGITLFAALQNPIVAVPQLVFLASWWCKCGDGSHGPPTALRLVLFASTIATLAMLAMQNRPLRTGAVAAVISLLLALVYFAAGRATGPARPFRRGVPWLVLATLVLVFPFVFRPFLVPTSAMENTLLQGDLVLVAQAGRAVRLGRGSLVVIRYPPDPRQTFFKRVVAVGGDRVRIEKQEAVCEWGEVSEPYAIHNTPDVMPVRDNLPDAPDFPLPVEEWQRFLTAHAGDREMTVPQGKLFVLGDNRDSSLDSRYWGWIDEGAVVGKPVLVYWSEPRRLRAGEREVPLARVRWVECSRCFELKSAELRTPGVRSLTTFRCKMGLAVETMRTPRRSRSVCTAFVRGNVAGESREDRGLRASGAGRGPHRHLVARVVPMVIRLLAMTPMPTQRLTPSSVR